MIRAVESFQALKVNKKGKHLSDFAAVTLQALCECITNEVTNYMVPEPGGSLLHSPEPATGPYPEQGECTPHTHARVSLR
jgi:hypothetical protein